MEISVCKVLSIRFWYVIVINIKVVFKYENCVKSINFKYYWIYIYKKCLLWERKSDKVDIFDFFI